MLSWRSLVCLAALVVSTVGCRSAHIKDAYISRDEAGVRRTGCIRPEWQKYFVVIELMSFKEDTLIWPFLVERFNPGVVLVPPWAAGDDELVEFGNFAPGKTDGIEAFEITQVQTDANGQQTVVDLGPGAFQWDIYIDDEDEPRSSIALDIDPGCPCVGTAVDCN